MVVTDEERTILVGPGVETLVECLERLGAEEDGPGLSLLADDDGQSPLVVELVAVEVT